MTAFTHYIRQCLRCIFDRWPRIVLYGYLSIIPESKYPNNPASPSYPGSLCWKSVKNFLAGPFVLPLLDSTEITDSSIAALIAPLSSVLTPPALVSSSGASAAASAGSVSASPPSSLWGGCFFPELRPFSDYALYLPLWPQPLAPTLLSLDH